MVRTIAFAALLALIPPDSPAPFAAEPTAPPAFDDAAAMAAHAEDVVDYTLRATLDPAAHTVHGEGTIAWRNTAAAPVRELWLHLYLNAFKNQRSVFMRERVGGRGSEPPEDWGWIDVKKLVLRGADGGAVDLWPGAEVRRPDDEDETDARVPLPRDVQPGESISLDVVFDDKLPIVIERTGYRGTFHMVGQWFPKIARLERDGTWAHFPFHHLSEFYADYGTYDVTLDAPQAFTIGATGPIAEARVEGGRRIERHVQGDVHDFAWTAWDEFQVARDSIDGIDVTLLYPRGFTRDAQRELATLRFAIPYFGAHYGRYPYPVLTVVHPQSDASEAGGMEYPTLITTGGPWWMPSGVLVPELVTIHEFGHQWFYGLVGTNELRWPFLDEGLNQFSEVRGLGAWRGEGSLLDMAGLRVSDASAAAVRSAARVHDEPVAQPANAFSSGANYGALVYARTATILETLARVYGEDPVMRALGRYTRTFRFQHPVPDDLIASFEQVMGARVAATLRAALFDKAWVDYAIDGVSSEEGWALVRRRGTLSFPVEIELTYSDGSTERVAWNGEGESMRITPHGKSSALRSAVVDPDDRVLCDGNVQNNHGSSPEGGAGARRTLERATYFAQLLLQAVSP